MVQIIAEIGCNHKGEIDIAVDLIKAAASAGADVAKFQKRHNRELLDVQQYEAPHPNPANAYGDTYGAHREALELDLGQHRELMAECLSAGIEYSTSVWDLTSAKEIASLNPRLIKIPSATNLHWRLQEFLCREFAGEIHVSTGMTSHEEIDALIDFYTKLGRQSDLVVYACTSGYPVNFEDTCLMEIETLHRRFGKEVRAIGFSGHHLGIAVDVAALAVGKMSELQHPGSEFGYIERHFTLDRTWKGPDHAASLEPTGLQKLCRDIKAAVLALQYKQQGILDVEQVQRDKLKWREHPQLVGKNA